MVGSFASTENRDDFARAAWLDHDRLRDFIEVASEWCWETDPDDRFTYVGPGVERLGWEPGALLGRRRTDLAAAAERGRPRWRRHLALLERQQSFHDFVYAMPGPDGEERWVSLSGKPIVDADGRFRGYRGAGRDVTAEMRVDRELRQAKAASEAANQAKSDFLARMSHELRTPLNAVIGFSEALLADYAGRLAGKQREYVDLIRGSGKHLLDLVNDVLDLAKVEAGTLHVDPEPIDLVAVVKECIAMVLPKLERAELRLETELPLAPPACSGDRRRLVQILLNLFSNAIKFTPAGGVIRVALRAQGAQALRLEVADTGIGIAPEEMRRIFTPFATTRPSHGVEGAGLGLPITKSLVERHGGSIAVASEPGRGTTVTIDLPNCSDRGARPRADP